LKTRSLWSKLRRVSALKCRKEVQRRCFLVDKFREGVLVHFVGVVKDELDGRNPPWRIREVPVAIRSCRGAGKLRKAFFKCKAQKKLDSGIQVDKDHWITRLISFHGFVS
jgi:hypothetical protein